MELGGFCSIDQQWCRAGARKRRSDQIRGVILFVVGVDQHFVLAANDTVPVFVTGHGVECAVIDIHFGPARAGVEESFDRFHLRYEDHGDPVSFDLRSVFEAHLARDFHVGKRIT